MAAPATSAGRVPLVGNALHPGDAEAQERSHPPPTRVAPNRSGADTKLRHTPCNANDAVREGAGQEVRVMTVSAHAGHRDTHRLRSPRLHAPRFQTRFQT